MLFFSCAGPTRGLVAAAVISFVLVLTTAVAFVGVHARLFPGDRWRRWESALAMCVNWPMAARAPAVMLRHAVGRLHPVAVVLAVPDARGAADFVARVRRDFAHPLALGAFPVDARTCVEWYADFPCRALGA